MKILRSFSVLLVFSFLLAGCESTYYAAMEKVGIEKRDILADRVEDAAEAQEETAEQFTDALAQFRSLVDFDGGELEKLYDRLSAEFAASEASAKRLSGRIDAIENVAEDLFREWERELEAYSSERLRRQSQTQLTQTRVAYRELMATMRRAEARVDPVLDAFRDQVLFLKHNLNAMAINALDAEAATLQNEVEGLIAEMETSIREANAFAARLR